MALRGDLILICLTTTLLACGEDSADTAGADTCELLDDASIVLAGPDLASAPLIQPDSAHLVELTPGEAGLVQIQVPEGGLFDVLLDRRNALHGVESDGQPIDFSQGRPVMDCPDALPAAYELDLPDPGLYTLTLGPVDAAEVLLMVQTIGPSQSIPSH